MPLKLDVSLSLNERDVFSYRTLAEFDRLNSTFQNAPNYREVNRGADHGAFSAGLAAYRRYLCFTENSEERQISEQGTCKLAPAKNDNQPIINYEPQRVDFSHTEFCAGCNPESCLIEGKDFSGGNWRDILIAVTEGFLVSKPNAQDLIHKSIYKNGKRPFLLNEKPQNGLAARQISNGYWVLLHLSIKGLVFSIGKLCEFCGVDLDDVNITYVPKQSADGMRSINITRDDSAWFAQQPVRDAFRAWLTKHNPEWSSGTVTMHYSDAYYLYNNKRGITLEEVLTSDDGLQRAYDAIERFYTDNPTRTNNPSGSAQSYVRG